MSPVPHAVLLGCFPGRSLLSGTYVTTLALSGDHITDVVFDTPNTPANSDWSHRQQQKRYRSVPDLASSEPPIEPYLSEIEPNLEDCVPAQIPEMKPCLCVKVEYPVTLTALTHLSAQSYFAACQIHVSKLDFTWQVENQMKNVVGRVFCFCPQLLLKLYLCWNCVIPCCIQMEARPARGVSPQESADAARTSFCSQLHIFVSMTACSDVTLQQLAPVFISIALTIAFVLEVDQD